MEMVEKVGAVRTVVSFTPTEPVAWPEGLAIDTQGNIYVGILAAGQIIKIAPDGTQSLLAEFEVCNGAGRVATVLVGLAVDRPGNIYAVLLTQDAPGAVTHGIWRVTPDGTKELVGAIPDLSGGPNQVALDHQGNIYVTDSYLGVIWRIAAGASEVTCWLKDRRLAPATDDDNPCNVRKPYGGANGLAFDRNGDLYVASSNRAMILRIKIDPATGAPEVEEFVQDCARLTAMDHMAFDIEGNLYVARAVHEIVRVSPSGDIDVVVSKADGIDGPSNLYFGTGPAAYGTGEGNQSFLYFTNHGHSEHKHCLQVVDIGIPGLPMPQPG